MTHTTDRQRLVLNALVGVRSMTLAELREVLGVGSREYAFPTMYSLRQRRWVLFFEDPAAEPGHRFRYALTPTGKAQALMLQPVSA